MSMQQAQRQMANVLLDEVDKELERRGHCFVHYADDANVYVRSHRAGKRVMALLRSLYARLHLTVNETPLCKKSLMSLWDKLRIKTKCNEGKSIFTLKVR